MCSRALASARSVPGVGCRCSVAWRAVGGAPGGRPRSACRRARAARSGSGPAAASSRPTFAPTSSSVSAAPRSASGNGRPRSMPKARMPGGRGRGHAEPSVVVDVPGPQRDPGELAQRVRLLVGQAAAAEDRDRVAAVLRPGCRGCRRRPGRAPRPRWPAAAARPGRSRTSGVVSRSGWSSSSAAVQPFWHRPPRLVGNCRGRTSTRPSASARERHAALQGAVRAVGGDLRAHRAHGIQACGQGISLLRQDHFRPATSGSFERSTTV